jgi:hypothetical protein
MGDWGVLVVSAGQIRKLNRVLKGLKVYTTHLPYKRTYKVCGLVDTPANQHMFNYEGRKASVAEYFSEKYKPLQYDFVPCVDVGGKRDAPRLMPPEVCFIVQGQRTRSMDSTMTSNILKQASVEPQLR